MGRCKDFLDLLHPSKYLTHFAALCNIDLASFLRWYVAVELHDPVYARRFYSTYELLEESMLKVCSLSECLY